VAHSTTFPHLRPLSRDLIRQSDDFTLYGSPPHRKAGTINVVVFEVYRDTTGLASRILEHITDVQRLLDRAHQDLCAETALLLYLVTSMSASVVNILGTALECQPEVFGAHLHSSRRCGKHGCEGNTSADYRGCLGCGVELNTSMQAAGSLIPIPIPYFSFPFRRPVAYSPKVTLANRFESYNLLVERVSGTIHQQRNQGQHVGKKHVSFSHVLYCSS